MIATDTNEIELVSDQPVEAPVYTATPMTVGEATEAFDKLRVAYGDAKAALDECKRLIVDIDERDGWKQFKTAGGVQKYETMREVLMDQLELSQRKHTTISTTPSSNVRSTTRFAHMCKNR